MAVLVKAGGLCYNNPSKNKERKTKLLHIKAGERDSLAFYTFMIAAVFLLGTDLLREDA